MKQVNIKQLLPRDPVRRDFLVCLMIWFVLEAVCFAIVAAFTLPPAETQSRKLFTLSIPLGLGGACAMAGSTQITLALLRQPRQKRQRLIKFTAFVLSWLGLIGIGFPLLILSFRIALWGLSPLQA